MCMIFLFNSANPLFSLQVISEMRNQISELWEQEIGELKGRAEQGHCSTEQLQGALLPSQSSERHPHHCIKCDIIYPSTKIIRNPLYNIPGASL